MLQWAIEMSKNGDTAGGVRDLNARSLALSVLLGTHPPELPARALVALAELFGIAGGTMRTALSRMVAAGEVEAVDGWYRLAGRLVARQRSQDLGRRPADDDWDGAWHTVVAVADQRDLADRRAFRSTLTDHRFGELRPDIWLRPSNLAPPTGLADAIVLTAPLAGDGRPAELDLVARLWDLPVIAATSRRLGAHIDELRSRVDLADEASIPEAFLLSAAIVRHLRAEPRLPAPLVPDDWPVDDLRAAYDELEADFQRLLRRFLRANR